MEDIMGCIFGIDIGGTEIKIGKFKGRELVLKTSIKTDTSAGGRYVLPDLFRKIDELSKGEKSPASASAFPDRFSRAS